MHQFLKSVLTFEKTKITESIVKKCIVNTIIIFYFFYSMFHYWFGSSYVI